MLKKSFFLLTSLILLITLCALYFFDRKTEPQPITQNAEKKTTNKTNVKPENAVNQPKTQSDGEVLAKPPITTGNTNQDDFSDLLERTDYLYKIPKQTVVIQQQFFELLKCRNLLRNLIKNNNPPEKISANIVDKQTLGKPLLTLESNYYQCRKVIDISIASDTINRIDSELTIIADRAEQMGNQKVPAVWAMMLLTENDREPKSYDKLVRYKEQKSRAIATLRKLMDKGHKQSAWHLVNLYTNPYQMDTYNQDKAGEILNKFYGLEGVALDDRLQQLIRRERPF